MDNDEFLNAFLNIDILKAEGVAKAVGRVVANLHEGMLAGGMTEFAAQNLLVQSVRTFFIVMNEIYSPGNQQ